MKMCFGGNSPQTKASKQSVYLFKDTLCEVLFILLSALYLPVSLMPLSY